MKGTFDEHHNAARFLEFVDQILQGMGTDDALALGFVGQEFVHFGRRSIVGANDKAVIGHVQDQILAHHRQTNQTNIRSKNQKKKKGQNWLKFELVQSKIVKIWVLSSKFGFLQSKFGFLQSKIGFLQSKIVKVSGFYSKNC